MAKVKSVEGSEEWFEIPFNEDFHTAIAYSSNVGGLEAMISFYFVENQLYSGRYGFIEEHESNNLYVKDFDVLDKNLQSMYGSTKVVELWNREERKDDRSSWGYEIKRGFLSISTTWKVPQETPVTDIMHFLSGRDFSFFHELNYDSIELSNRLDSLME